MFDWWPFAIGNLVAEPVAGGSSGRNQESESGGWGPATTMVPGFPVSGWEETGVVQPKPQVVKHVAYLFLLDSIIAVGCCVCVFGFGIVHLKLGHHLICPVPQLGHLRRHYSQAVVTYLHRFLCFDFKKKCLHYSGLKRFANGLGKYLKQILNI